MICDALGSTGQLGQGIHQPEEYRQTLCALRRVQSPVALSTSKEYSLRHTHTDQCDKTQNQISLDLKRVGPHTAWFMQMRKLVTTSSYTELFKTASEI